MAASRPLRVLYVDDEEDIRTIVAMALALDGGIECRTAESAAAARAVLAQGWRPDLALLDMMMPVTDGGQFLAELHDDPATADLPVALLTAGTAEARAIGGIAGVITKPFDPLALAGRIRVMVSHRAD